MFRYFGSILLLVLLAIILQQFLPAITPLASARVLPVALVFLCTAVTVPAPVMLLLAFCCGFITDLENAVGPHGGDALIYSSPVEQLPFGYSIVLYPFSPASRSSFTSSSSSSSSISSAVTSASVATLS
ncbi:MAG: hypothetical protein MUF31_08865 [Akkermansiaceae bacterium]|nr:hypothetical protein [Akkermansiaceae bacterium]